MLLDEVDHYLQGDSEDDIDVSRSISDMSEGLIENLYGKASKKPQPKSLKP